MSITAATPPEREAVLDPWYDQDPLPPPERRSTPWTKRLALAAVAGAVVCGSALGAGVLLRSEPGPGGALNGIGDPRLTTGLEGEPAVSLRLGERARIHLALYRDAGSGVFQRFATRRVGIVGPGTVEASLAFGHDADHAPAGRVLDVSRRLRFEVPASPPPTAGLPPGRYAVMVQMRSP
jgi:hypothetical protein